MASIDLWIGGNATFEDLPKAGDAVLRSGTDTDVSVAWPSDRLPMGSVHPYYVCMTFRRRTTGSIGSRKAALKFAAMPESIEDGKFLKFNFAIAAHDNGTLLDRPFTVNVSIDGTYRKEPFTVNPQQSVTITLPVDDMGATAEGIFFEIIDVPDTAELYAVANGFQIVDAAEDTVTTDFNAETWLGHYISGFKSEYDAESDRIASYVNWPQSDTIVKDNGNIEISPIGFPEANQSGVPNEPTCSDDYDQENNPPFVKQSYGVKYENTQADIVFRQKVRYSEGKFRIPVESIDKSDDKLMFTLLGDFSATADAIVSLTPVAAPGSDIEGTALQVTVAEVEQVAYDATTDTTTFLIDIPAGCTVTHVGRDTVDVEIGVGDDTIVSLTAQNTGNGVYSLTKDADTDTYSFIRISDMPQDIINGTMQDQYVEIDDMSNPEHNPFADPRVDDNVWACNGVKNIPHFRKGYSDKEVFGFVQDSTEGISKNAYSTERDAGAFVNWFLYPGSTPFTNAKGSVVNIENFGLGGYYTGETGAAVTAEMDDGTPAYEQEPSHPVIHWGYGSNSDAKVDMTNEPALPRDWPFTGHTPYSNVDYNNSITLVREGAHVTGDAYPVGNLDYEEDDGEGNIERYECNRHVVTIYNELKPKEDGTTVVKPTFIHLPAPLSTKDGDTCEIEVALENLSFNEAFKQGTVKDLSGYYALIAQPRVYVCGGFQEFSTTRYPITDLNIGSGSFTFKTTEAIRDLNGEPIVHNPDKEGDHDSVAGVSLPVRVHLTNSAMEPAEAWVDGIATAETYPSDEDPAPTTITVNGDFPWSVSDRRFDIGNVAVCGVVFVRLNQEIDPETPTTLNMGLRTRCENLIGLPDGGTGESGKLQEFNRFFSLSDDLTDTTRTHFPEGDKRYLLATVFQGATNTFQWKLSGRKRLNSIAEAMTMWADAGTDSITDRAWHANYDLVNHFANPGDFDDFSRITHKDGVLAFSADDVPLTYAKGSDSRDDGAGHTGPAGSESAIAYRLRVKMPATSKDTVSDASGNPVRQAAKAYQQLIEDFSKLRLRLDYNSLFSSEGTTIDVGVEPRSAFPAIDGFFDRDTTDTNDYEAYELDGVGDDMWLFKPKTMPRLLVNAFFDYEAASASPKWEGFRAKFRDYIDNLPYYKDATLYSVPKEIEAPVDDDIGMPGTQYEPCNRSLIDVVSDMLNADGRIKTKSIAVMLDDFRRLADLQTVDYDESLRRIETAAGNYGAAQFFCPFVDMVSLDSTEAPVIGASTAGQLTSEQRELLPADVIRQYGWAGNNNNTAFISEFQPNENDNSGALAELIKTYLPLQQSKFGRRFYSSNRVVVHDGTIEDQNVYDRYKLEAELSAGSDGDRMNRFVCDNFISDPVNSFDPNADWFTVNENRVISSLSSAPYMWLNNAQEGLKPEFHDQATYTRVYMSFTFSAKLGRWLTTGYRQYPSAYLTPLYGNRALSEKLPTAEGEHEIWANSACDNISSSYKGLEYVPYGMISPMDIHVSCIPALYKDNPFLDTGVLNPDLANDVDTEASSGPKATLMARLRKPYMPVSDGGIGLNIPCNVNGEYNAGVNYMSKVEHANIWSVRKYIRPATGALGKQGVIDIPGLEGYDDGSIGSPGLYNMFDWPARNVTRYALPDQHSPTDDRTSPTLMWALPGGETGGRLMARTGGEDHPIGHVTPSMLE